MVNTDIGNLGFKDDYSQLNVYLNTTATRGEINSGVVDVSKLDIQAHGVMVEYVHTDSVVFPAFYPLVIAAPYPAGSRVT